MPDPDPNPQDIPTINTDALTDADTIDGILDATTIPWSSKDARDLKATDWTIRSEVPEADD